MLGALMMCAGVLIMFSETEPLDPRYVYDSRFALTTIGIIFFMSGLTLFVGKLAKMHRAVGHGLFMTYCCFLFATLLSWVSFGFAEASGSLIGMLIAGALHLRWKYHVYYYDTLDKRNGKRYANQILDQYEE